MSRNPILVTGSSKVEVVGAQNTLITQLPNVFAADAQIPIKGVLMTLPQIVTVLQNSVAAIQAAESLKAQTHVAVVTADTALAAARDVVHDLQAYSIVALGPNNAKLALLGFSAPKAGAKTPAVVAAAAVKGKATREARGTKGKNQKKGIHGVVTAEAPAVKKP